jgi:hypothetical protein
LLSINVSDGIVRFSRFNSGGNHDLDELTAIHNGQWYHVVAVYNSLSGHKIYIDGVLNNSESTLLTADVPTDTVYIGYRQDATPGKFDGSIDDVRIYKRALSNAEIKRLYNMGK